MFSADAFCATLLVKAAARSRVYGRDLTLMSLRAKREFVPLHEPSLPVPGGGESGLRDAKARRDLKCPQGEHVGGDRYALVAIVIDPLHKNLLSVTGKSCAQSGAAHTSLVRLTPVPCGESDLRMLRIPLAH